MLMYCTLSLQKGRRLRALVMYHRHGNTIKKLTIRILEIPEFPYNVMRDRLKEARVLKYQFDPFIRLACSTQYRLLTGRQRVIANAVLAYRSPSKTSLNDYNLTSGVRPIFTRATLH